MKKVLVLEDEANIRSFVVINLKRAGYETIEAETGEEALEQLELDDAADRPVGSYSLGMKQRLGIARALLCRPELLILDEPTNGLDPAGIKQVRDLLKRMREEYEMTVMVSSHILGEMEAMADTVGIIPVSYTHLRAHETL